MARLVEPSISAGLVIREFLPISTSDLSFVCCLAFCMIWRKRSPTSARMVMTYWRADSGSATYQQPPFFSKMRRMLLQSAPASESVKYMSSPSVVMQTSPSMSATASSSEA